MFLRDYRFDNFQDVSAENISSKQVFSIAKSTWCYFNEKIGNLEYSDWALKKYS